MLGALGDYLIHLEAAKLINTGAESYMFANVGKVPVRRKRACVDQEGKTKPSGLIQQQVDRGPPYQRADASERPSGFRTLYISLCPPKLQVLGYK